MYKVSMKSLRTSLCWRHCRRTTVLSFAALLSKLQVKGGVRRQNSWYLYWQILLLY